LSKGLKVFWAKVLDKISRGKNKILQSFYSYLKVFLLIYLWSKRLRFAF